MKEHSEDYAFGHKQILYLHDPTKPLPPKNLVNEICIELGVNINTVLLATHFTNSFDRDVIIAYIEEHTPKTSDK